MSFSSFRGGGVALKLMKPPPLSTCLSLSLLPTCWNISPILRLPIKMHSTSEDGGSSSCYSSGSQDFLGPLHHQIKGHQSDHREEAEVKMSKVVTLTVCCPHCQNKFNVLAPAGPVSPSSDDHHHHTSKRTNTPTSSNSTKKRRR
ncbi:UNVERIFIED_CONTAM: hypothetical protein Sindi_2720500 [Sesamum indicum]